MIDYVYILTDCTYFRLNHSLFHFDCLQIFGHKNCTFLRDALNRYETIISSQYKIIQDNLKHFSHVLHKKTWLEDRNFRGYLDSANVFLNGECKELEYPSLEMIENCK